MAKLICKKCGKIFSDVEAFCPKCGAPSEISMRAPLVGGRQMAQAGSGVRRDEWRMDQSQSAAAGGTGRRSVRMDRSAASGRSAKPSSKAKPFTDRSFGKAGTFKADDVSFGAGDQSAFCRTENHSQVRHKKPVFDGSKTSPAKIIGIVAAVIIIINVVMNIIGSVGAGAYDAIRDFAADEGYDTYTYDDYYAINSDGEEFLTNLEYALESRCDTVNNMDISSMTAEQTADFYNTVLNDEMTVIEQYRGKELGGDGINYYRDTYLDGLQSQIDGLQYYTTDKSEYLAQWGYGYNQRIYAIVNLYDFYGFYLPDDLINDYRAGYDEVYGGDLQYSDEDASTTYEDEEDVQN